MKQLRLLQLLLFIGFLASQVSLTPQVMSPYRPLPQPVSANDIRVLSLGEPAIIAKLISYWLLSYDTQSGQVVAYETLNYKRLAGWLGTIASLDPLSSEPAMVAAGVFIDVKDNQRKLVMIEFVREQFKINPVQNWRWMAQLVMLSKYRLQNMPLALSLADDLRQLSAGKEIPYWATEMQAYLLQDMGELEAALVLIKAMINEGTIKDAGELQFLLQRLSEIEASLAEKAQTMSDLQQN